MTIAPPAIEQTSVGAIVAPELTTVAVLPFKLINSAAEQYLGAGLVDALIVSLSNLTGLLVRPTASVMPFAASDTDVLEAGRALGVAVVIDGKIKQAGDCLRVTVQAVSVGDGCCSGRNNSTARQTIFLRWKTKSRLSPL